MATGILLAILLATISAFIEWSLSSASLKERISQTVATESGAELDWQKLSFDLLPRPAFIVTEAFLKRQGSVQARIGRLEVTPALLPLFFGELRLSSVRVNDPEIVVQLPAAEEKRDHERFPEWIELVYIFAYVFGGAAQEIADVDVDLLSGRVQVSRDQQELLALEGLNLHLDLSIKNQRAARATLQGSSSSISIWKGSNRLGVDEVELDGEVILEGSELRVLLDRFVLGVPEVGLSGSLVQRLDTPEVSVFLTGKAIDVETTRRLVLELAGESGMTDEIFSYLRGGLVEEITFRSQGKTPGELGNLANLRLEGRLVQGAISIPPLGLDLQEVFGDITLEKGVLSGQGLTARLAGAAGREGSLQIGFGSENDIFKLDLLLETELSDETKDIVTAIVDNEAFGHEAKRITNLRGNCHGRMTIGDSLGDITAKVEIHELAFSADYDRLPVGIVTRSGQATITENQISLNNVEGAIGNSTFVDLYADIGYQQGVFLEIQSSSVVLVMDEIYPWLRSFPEISKNLKLFSLVSGKVVLNDFRFQGDVHEPEKWQIVTTGRPINLLLRSPGWDQDIELRHGDFRLDGKALNFDDFEVVSGESRIIGEGRLPSYHQGLEFSTFNLDGKLAENTLAWLWQNMEIPEILQLHAPVQLSGVRVERRGREQTTLTGSFFLEKGINLFIDLAHRKNVLAINQMRVEDQYSTAEMSLRYGMDDVSFSFNGDLQPNTMNGLFRADGFDRSGLDGKMTLTAKMQGPFTGKAQGYVRGKNISIPLSFTEHVHLDDISLIGEGRKIMAVASSLSWRNRSLTPLQASFEFDENPMRLRVIEANICGVDMPGEVVFGGAGMTVNFSLTGEDLDVAENLACLFPQKVKMSGLFDLHGTLSSTGTLERLAAGLRGPFRLVFKNGVIEEGRTLAKVLEVLNVTEIFRGKLPNFKSSGLAYSSIVVEGRLAGKKIVIESLVMDGKTLEIAGRGEINLPAGTIDMDLMAAPFKTVDSIVKLIPGVNYLFGGNLIALPLSVEGKFDDPRVEIMSADSVGSGLQRLWERTTQSPSRLLDFLTPDGSKKENQ